VPHPDRLPPLSDAQLEIMNVVWDLGEVSVGDVWAVLSEQRSVARNTVQTVMTRMSEKGWLKHRKQGRAFLFKASVERDSTLRVLVDRLVERAFRGSAEGLVLSMLEGRGLSHEEAARIRKLISDARKEHS
jgi:BlaI family penicillinase repressor